MKTGSFFPMEEKRILIYLNKHLKWTSMILKTALIRIEGYAPLQNNEVNPSAYFNVFGFQVGRTDEMGSKKSIASLCNEFNTDPLGIDMTSEVERGILSLGQSILLHILDTGGDRDH